MASLNWPPEETFKYEFRTDLTLSIPLLSNKKLKRVDTKKKEENGRDEH